MSVDPVSVFDLNPAEKLHLVENVRNELTASPTRFPSTTGKRGEMARRKANLMNNPASGLSWDEVKQRVRTRYRR